MHCSQDSGDGDGSLVMIYFSLHGMQLTLPVSAKACTELVKCRHMN